MEFPENGDIRHILVLITLLGTGQLNAGVVYNAEVRTGNKKSLNQTLDLWVIYMPKLTNFPILSKISQRYDIAVEHRT